MWEILFHRGFGYLEQVVLNATAMITGAGDFTLKVRIGLPNKADGSVQGL